VVGGSQAAVTAQQEEARPPQQWVGVRVSGQVKQELVKLKLRHQRRLGRPVSLNEVIERLIDGQAVKP